MEGTHWYYRPGRTLILQKSKDAKDAKHDDIRKSYRALGAKATAALQAMKTKEVEFLTTP
jgi:hypothetical protein